MTYRTGLWGLLLTAAAVVCVVGCADARRTAVPVDRLAVQDKAAAMAAAQETLRQMHFVIEKYDLEAGYIRTFPLRAGQFFEPWRQDNASMEALAQANLHSLRRTVEIFVEMSEPSARPSLHCRVTVEKLSLPPRPIRTMSRMANLYTDSSQRVQSLDLDEAFIAAMEWIDMGTDAALEQRILARIQRQGSVSYHADRVL